MPILMSKQGKEQKGKHSKQKGKHNNNNNMKNDKPKNVDDLPQVSLNLSSVKHILGEDGTWRIKVDDETISKMQKKNETLKEQNNMSRLKIELLIDMITRKNMESIKMKKEIDQIQDTLAKVSSTRFQTKSTK